MHAYMHKYTCENALQKVDSRPTQGNMWRIQELWYKLSDYIIGLFAPKVAWCGIYPPKFPTTYPVMPA